MLGFKGGAVSTDMWPGLTAETAERISQSRAEFRGPWVWWPSWGEDRFGHTWVDVPLWLPLLLFGGPAIWLLLPGRAAMLRVLIRVRYAMWSMTRRVLLLGELDALLERLKPFGPPPNECLNCGYCLDGLDEDAACPECGRNERPK